MDHLRSLRWRSFDKSFTFMFDKAYTLITMKKSWKFMRWEKRWEKRWDLTSSPKHYFWIIYAHYDEEVSTNHLRSCLTKHIRSLRWRNHENSWGEKRGEKRGEISPLHLNIIFGSFTLITMKKFRQIIYVHVWQSIYAHYDEEIMKIHEVRKEVRKEVRSHLFT